MNFFKKNESLELKSQIDDLMAEREVLQKQMKDYERTISSFMSVKSSYEDEKNKLMLAHKAELQSIKQALEIERKSVAKKVNQELAKIGVSEFVAEEISPESNSTSPDAIINKWLSMPESTEKHDFFKQYEKVISKATKK